MEQDRELLANASLDSRRRELELQLVKIRNEASAARLEAKAAEVELMIRRLSGERVTGASAADSSGTDNGGSSHQIHPSQPSPGPTHAATPPSRELQQPPEFSAPTPFQDWAQVRSAIRSSKSPLKMDAAIKNSASNQSKAPGTSEASSFDHPLPRIETETEQPSRDVSTFTRTDAQHEVPRHHFEPEEKQVTDSTGGETPVKDPGIAAPLIGVVGSEPPESSPMYDADADGDLAIEEDAEIDEDELGKRSRPGAWLVSTLVHVGILVLLALVGLSTQRPKDQVALTASAPNAEQVSMETFEIESTEQPETEPTPNEPNPSEVQYDLSPVGEVSASDMISDAPPAPASTSMAEMFNRSSAASSAMSMKPNSDATMEFCGVKGGGNHFVYLVDSSGSMGDAFGSARAELLRSIDLLKPEQRFYVVFFDEKPDYMRLADANVDEPRSVKANRVNRDALKRWAMRIQKDRGRAPYDPLKFALKLKPDVIFLLSDGEFPQGIEDMLKEENRVVNLFGDNDPISIIHTIGYYSKDGESRMRRIAQQHGGMYRHVPKP